MNKIKIQNEYTKKTIAVNELLPAYDSRIWKIVEHVTKPELKALLIQDFVKTRQYYPLEQIMD